MINHYILYTVCKPCDFHVKLSFTIANIADKDSFSGRILYRRRGEMQFIRKIQYRSWPQCSDRNKKLFSLSDTYQLMMVILYSDALIHVICLRYCYLSLIRCEPDGVSCNHPWSHLASTQLWRNDGKIWRLLLNQLNTPGNLNPKSLYYLLLLADGCAYLINVPQG